MKNNRMVNCFLIIICILFACDGKDYERDKLISEITAEEIINHIEYLASDELNGRRAATYGDTLAVEYIAEEFRRIGLKPIDDKDYLQVFEFEGGISLSENNSLSFIVNNNFVKLELDKDFVPMNISSNERFEGDVVFAGYGISAPKLGYDDYESVDVEDKSVIIMRYSPRSEGKDFSEYETLTSKIMTARKEGAGAVLIFSGSEDELLPLEYRKGAGTAGIPVINIRPKKIEELFNSLGKNIESIQKSINKTLNPQSFLMEGIEVDLETNIKIINKKSFNVIGYIEGRNQVLKDEVIIVGAHYDHLGRGGEGSLGEFGEIHNGADDNASGVAGIIEVAEYLYSKELNRTVLFIAFGAEELGTLGSGYYVDNPVFPIEKTVAMINLDMIGRMKNSRLILNGAGTSPVWKTIAESLNSKYNFDLSYNEGGYGGSDQANFYARDIPVLFLFTGTHLDYHKPTDDPEKINSEAEMKIVRFLADIILGIDKNETKPEFVKVREEEKRTMKGVKVTMGVVPDFSGGEGFKISAVREGRPAERAGLKPGDTIVRMGDTEIKNIYEYMEALKSIRPGDKVQISIKRGDKILKLEVQF